VASLSRERITEAGLRLIDRDGPPALTMRALAVELSVTPTAIYYYFPGREAVLEGIVDHLAAGIVAASHTEGDWREQLQVLLSAMAGQSSAHPATVAWVITEYAHRPPVLRIYERILAILLGAGFRPGDAARIKGIVLRFCAGHMILDATAPDESRIDHAELLRLGLDVILSGLAARFEPAGARESG
jgi:AcrR family transcriptional regulator